MTGNLAPGRLARITPFLAGPVERGELTGAVALVARGETVHVDTVGVQDSVSGQPMRRDTIFRIASMTKPVLAAVALMLIEEGRFALDDPIERWLPELGQRRVLRAIDSPLDDTVAAERPISVRDLMTMRLGLGAVMAPPETYPIQTAMAQRGVAPGACQIPFDPDEYMRRLGELPLIHQPGTRWLYHTASDVLGVLIARVAGRPLGGVLAEHLFVPLGMADTGFHLPKAKAARLATAYGWNAQGDGLAIWDKDADGAYSEPPAFPNLLVSTADDYLAFARMLLAKGRGPTGRILSRASVTLMMTDQITPEQKAASFFAPGFWDNNGWGFGGAVVTRRHDIASNPGAYGWTGGFGTSFVVDPAEGLVAMLLTQRLMRGPDDMTLARDLFTLAYAAIDD